MKYTIEFGLPDNKTIEDELQGTYVCWSIWGYSGIAKAKPVQSEESQVARDTNVPTNDLISREEVLRAIITAGEVEPDLGYTHLHKVIENLPSEERKGRRQNEYVWGWKS